jgi:hypothetical protein
VDPTWNKGTVNAVYATKDYGGCLASGMTLNFSGGGGSNAAATLNMIGGVATFDNGGYLVKSATVTNPGSGYTSNPTVTVSGGSACHNLQLEADTKRFIIDGGGSAHPFAGDDGILSFQNYVIWDFMDLRNLSGTKNGGEYNGFGTANNQVTVSNSYVHNIVPNGGNDSVYMMYFYADGSQPTKLSEVYNTVVTNGEAAYVCFNGGGVCSYATIIGNGGTIYNSKLSFGIWMARATGVWHDNDIWANVEGDIGQHTNMFYTNPVLLNKTNYIYNNIFHDNQSGSSSQMPMDDGMSYVIYNNVCWICGAGGAIFSVTNDGGGTTPRNVYFWNNTFLAGYMGSASCFNGSPSSLAPYINVWLYNNHCITDQTGSHWFTMQAGTWNTVNGVSNPTNNTADSSNVVMSQSTAASQGYCGTVTNIEGIGGPSVCLPRGSVTSPYVPATSSNATVTFSGTNLTARSPGCGTSSPFALTSLCGDILGNLRPATGGWQAGAYQGAKASAPAIVQPSALIATGH